MPPANSFTVQPLTGSKKRFQQIDVTKGLAIVSVILLHAFERDILNETYAIYHIWQAVPVFMVLMGVNLGMDFTGSKPELSSLYTRKYFRKKAERILFPLLWVYVLSILAGLAWLLLYNQHKLEFNAYNFIGLLPVTGPGNYFVTLILQTIFFFPIIDYLFQRQPSSTIVLLIALEILFLVWSSHVRLFQAEDYLYSAALPRYFSAIAFGLVLSKSMLQPLRANVILLFLTIAAAGCLYLYRMVYADLNVNYMTAEWQTQSVLTFAYAAAIVWGLFKALPVFSDNKFLHLFAALGKASYHIFLIQIVYFGLFPKQSSVLMGLFSCLLAGYLFYKADTKYRLSKRILSRA
ncbi:acyltransferase [Pontibacter diazotrophicus]|uniref:Acyltransferase n=1 Tax=Pontibacter diazotrophicus TaxID=1400979 RepID=A0A3D8LA28_9BACT|nr:acyltransferase [Pontibacter diazotrophicus]RDV14203.1 acyltransferase [Pontibacter diazotrophicus]